MVFKQRPPSKNGVRTMRCLSRFSHISFRVFIVAIAFMAHWGIATGADSLVVLPRKFTLTGQSARQRMLVERVHNGQVAGEVTSGVTLQSSDPGVVRIEDGYAISAGDGKAVITARVGQHSATAEVSVVGQRHPQMWSFRNHVQPVLSKNGCNSGSCHGAAAGKNGFKLSLRGYDPEADFLTITRQSRGRRTVPSDPGRSLLLTKPTGAVPHKGGVRFTVDSNAYQVVSGWIATGHPGPKPDDPRLHRLEILPQQTTLAPGTTQQLVVRAHFTDGHTEDVTQAAKFTSTNITVAQVDDTGFVKVSGNGEGSIVAWYLSNNVVGAITVPFPQALSPDLFLRAERSNFIDDLVLNKLQSLNLPPSALATDAEFLRRAFVDTLGFLPTPTETRGFLADQSQNKREQLVERLLSRPEFVDYWSYRWSDLFLLSGKRLRPQALKSFYQWIRLQVAQNTPWDEFAKGIVLAKGSTIDTGSANFYSLHQDPLDMAETVSMAFLGMSIQCARCHDHPLEKWTNDDYYGMVSLFTRIRAKGWGGDTRSGDGNRTIFSASDGELIQPRTGRPRLPRPLNGDSIAFDDPGDRRGHLVAWLTAPENPYFSRAIVNRIWANFMGVGIVEKVDDLRFTNPASNETLLSALAKRLVDDQYDLKALMRLILVSKTFQRSSLPVAGNETDTRYYSRFYPRRLKAEVLLDAISQATDIPTAFKDHPPGTRALQLPDTSIESSFLKTFGRPERLITCECERSNEPSMVQVLHIVNGDTINGRLAAKSGRIEQLVSAKLPDFKIIEELYLCGLCRYPTNEEMLRLLQVFSETEQQEKRLAIEDLFWSILSSKEFLFNH